MARGQGENEDAHVMLRAQLVPVLDTSLGLAFGAWLVGKEKTTFTLS